MPPGMCRQIKCESMRGLWSNEPGGGKGALEFERMDAISYSLQQDSYRCS